MSVTATATAAASAASSIINLHPHNHKKGVHLDSGSASSTSSSSGQAPATTQGLFSSLLQTLEQVAGVHPLASAAVAAIKAAAGTDAATPATSNLAASFNTTLQGAGGHSLSALGATVNAKV